MIRDQETGWERKNWKQGEWCRRYYSHLAMKIWTRMMAVDLEREVGMVMRQYKGRVGKTCWLRLKEEGQWRGVCQRQSRCFKVVWLNTWQNEERFYGEILRKGDESEFKHVEFVRMAGSWNADNEEAVRNAAVKLGERGQNVIYILGNHLCWDERNSLLCRDITAYWLRT